MTGTPRIRVEILSGWHDFEPRWQALVGAVPYSPFQSSFWLRLWYGVMPEAERVTPLPVAVVDAASGTDLMLLPLITRQAGGLRLIEFADLGITDCNAPAFAENVLAQPDLFDACWAAVRAALPAADAIVLNKMPATMAGRPNPFAVSAWARPSTMQTWGMHVTSDWQTYLQSIERHARKELGRSLRLCQQLGETRIVLARTRAEAEPVLAFVNSQQRERLSRSNTRHVLDDPGPQRFYAGLIGDGVPAGHTLAASLVINGEIVAGLLGVLGKPRVTVLRIANRSGDMARLGLGRLVLEQAFKVLHADGYSHFDLSIGDGEHKRRMGAAPTPLLDYIEPTSLRGRLHLEAQRSKEFVKAKLPTLARMVRRVRAPIRDAADAGTKESERVESAKSGKGKGEIPKSSA